MNHRDDPNFIPPTPWQVVMDDDDEECWGIVDANGEEVIVTDCGYYPPNRATAELIVAAVNKEAE